MAIRRGVDVDTGISQYKLAMSKAPMDRNTAQYRVDRMNAFEAELHEAVRAGAITLSEEQDAGLRTYLQAKRAELAAAFDVDLVAGARQLSLGMRLVSTLGAAAFCAALVLFFQRYWGYMDSWVQVGVAMAAPLVALGITEVLSQRETTPYFTALAAAVAFAAFVLNLQLLGLAFNLTPSIWGPGLMASFGLLLAYRYRVRLVLAAALLCGIVFTGGLLMTAGGYLWLETIGWVETWLAGSFLLLAVVSRVRQGEFDAVYRLVGLIPAIVALYLLGYVKAPSLLGEAEGVRVAYALLAFLISCGATTAGLWFRWPEAAYTGFVAVTGILIHQLFDWFWDPLPAFAFCLLVGAVALGLLWALKQLRRAVAA